MLAHSRAQQPPTSCTNAVTTAESAREVLENRLLSMSTENLSEFRAWCLSKRLLKSGESSAVSNQCYTDALRNFRYIRSSRGNLSDGEEIIERAIKNEYFDLFLHIDQVPILIYALDYCNCRKFLPPSPLGSSVLHQFVLFNEEIQKNPLYLVQCMYRLLSDALDPYVGSTQSADNAFSLLAELKALFPGRITDNADASSAWNYYESALRETCIEVKSDYTAVESGSLADGEEWVKTKGGFSLKPDLLTAVKDRVAKVESMLDFVSASAE